MDTCSLNDFLKHYLSSLFLSQEFPDFVKSILDGIICKGVESYKRVKKGKYEYYLNGDNWDKLTISHYYDGSDVLRTPQLENCVYSRNYDEVIIGEEKTKCRIVCSFKGNNNLTMMVGMGEGLKEEYIINITPTDNDNVHTRISYYEDLSQLRNQGKGVTKDDEQVLETVTKTAEVEGTYSSSRVVEIVRDILRDPANTKGLFTMLSFLNKSTEAKREYYSNLFLGLYYPKKTEGYALSGWEERITCIVKDENYVGYVKHEDGYESIYSGREYETQDVYKEGNNYCRLQCFAMDVNHVEMRLNYDNEKKCIIIKIKPNSNGKLIVETNYYPNVLQVAGGSLYADNNELLQMFDRLRIKPIISVSHECVGNIVECVRRIIDNPWPVVGSFEQKYKASGIASCVLTQAEISNGAGLETFTEGMGSRVLEKGNKQ